MKDEIIVLLYLSDITWAVHEQTPLVPLWEEVIPITFGHRNKIQEIKQRCFE